LALIRARAHFSQDAEEAWTAMLIQGAVVKAIGTGGNGKQLKDKDLNKVYSAIARAATSVNFTSPRTMVTYDARQYLAMKELIKARKIQVWDLNNVQLYNNFIADGLYDQYLNCLFLFNGAGLDPMVAHELAHAIQDWNDIKVDNNDWTEADAYIAQGLVENSLNIKPKKENPWTPLVDMVLAGTAKVNNPDWTKAYDEAAPKIHEIDFYQKIYGTKPVKPKPADFTDGEKGTAEKDTLAALLEANDKASFDILWKAIPKLLKQIP
jgi:hypothetical protein